YRRPRPRHRAPPRGPPDLRPAPGDDHRLVGVARVGHAPDAPGAARAGAGGTGFGLIHSAVTSSAGCSAGGVAGAGALPRSGTCLMKTASTGTSTATNVAQKNTDEAAVATPCSRAETTFDGSVLSCAPASPERPPPDEILLAAAGPSRPAMSSVSVR